jgi:hypothetical protein
MITLPLTGTYTDIVSVALPPGDYAVTAQVDVSALTYPTGDAQIVCNLYNEAGVQLENAEPAYSDFETPPPANEWLSDTVTLAATTANAAGGIHLKCEGTTGNPPVSQGAAGLANLNVQQLSAIN